MKKIMFVCHGNICRSPMAEFIFKNIVEENGMSNNFLVSSTATSDEEIWNGIGNPIYPPAAEQLKKNNIPFTQRQATRLKRSDYNAYDIFVCMDSRNIANARRIFGGDTENKVHRLLDFTAEPRDVSDPWYSRDFDTAYKDILSGCKALFKSLIK